jgi:hypothetical protein
MMVPDAINGAFEAFGGLMNMVNVLRIYRDKGYRGISIIPTVFFTAWGFWNLAYYPMLHQWMSFTGGLLIVVANTIWVAMALYYGPGK